MMPIITYCTNIHPASGMNEVRAALDMVAAPLRDRIEPDATLPIGLRLSNAESQELEDAAAIREFGEFLAIRSMRCVCVNGFPYGEFHNAPVKDCVHRPDWRSAERSEYTIRLARVLSCLMPEGASGGVSTSPLSYRPWGLTAADRARMTENIVGVALTLRAIAEETGKFVHIDIEPEPDGAIETVAEFSAWFEQELDPAARTAGVSAGELRTHVRLCLDACHLAVMHEEPGDSLESVERVGARVGRVQVSNALQVNLIGGSTRRKYLSTVLAPYADSIYLHQAVGSGGGRIVERWPDLVAALMEIESARAEWWRVHYHVPIFWAGDSAIGSTSEHLLATLEEVLLRGCCELFEIETYTWNVLPERLRLDAVDSIEREWRWLETKFAEIGARGSA